MEIDGKMPPLWLYDCSPDRVRAHGPKRNLCAAVEIGRFTRTRLCGLQLSLRELEPLTSALLAVFLAFVRARVARQQAQLLQLRTEFDIELEQCAGNAQTRRAGLTGRSAAIRQNQDVELVGQFGRQQR